MTPARVLDLDNLTLSKGSHVAPPAWATTDIEMCIMEAVAFVAGEPWSDNPECASKVISAFLRAWNDTLPDSDRNRLLKPYVLRLVGSAGTKAQEDARAWMCLDWLVRTYTPAWLRVAGLNDQAELLAGLGEFKAGMDVPSIRPTIDAVRAAARDAAWAAAGDAAWDAAGDAARAAAWDAAGDAAWDAAGDAAWDAAWAAAWAAAGDAARAAARDAAWAAARAAARAAAWDAARAAAWAAAWDAAWDAARAAARAAARDAARAAARAAAWDAARAAAWARLQPVVDELQPLALRLIDRMLEA
jgi:hypothetical protein